jgi:hypothetical protein
MTLILRIYADLFVSRGLALIVFFSQIYADFFLQIGADLRLLSAMILRQAQHKSARTFSTLQLRKSQGRSKKIQVRRAKFMDCIERENLISGLCSVSR